MTAIQMNPRKFFVGILLKNGKPVGHALSLHEQRFPIEPETKKELPKPSDEKKSTEEELTSTFESVFHNFVGTMESYRDFLQITLYTAPQLVQLMIEEEVNKYVEQNGTKREELSTTEATVYELDYQFFTPLVLRTERISSAAAGAGILPEVVMVGLISVYDGFLASLLKVVIETHEEIVLTSQKEMTYIVR
jgi:hypothetical protein